MEKKLSELDAEMIIYARKHLDDALHELDYSEEAKQDIRKTMEWLKELRIRLAK